MADVSGLDVLPVAHLANLVARLRNELPLAFAESSNSLTWARVTPVTGSSPSGGSTCRRRSWLRMPRVLRPAVQRIAASLAEYAWSSEALTSSFWPERRSRSAPMWTHSRIVVR